MYLANDKYSATLTSGYTAGDTTLYVSAVPTNVPTIVVVSKGTASETVFKVTAKGTATLTVARLKGANVNLDSGSPLTCLNNDEFINQQNAYATDGGSTDTYAITLDPAPPSYVEGMVVTFKANTANTGAATLNVNSLGAKTIKKNYNEDLTDNDIKANQVVTVVYDGTNFQLQSATSASIPVKATGAEITTGTDDAKFATPKAIVDAGFWRDVDGALAANSDVRLATQKAVKTYVDGKTYANLTTTAKARVYRNTSAQTATKAQWTKVQLNGESYDTGSNFDAATNYVFTVPVTGIYMITGTIKLASSEAGKNYYAGIFSGASNIAEAALVAHATGAIYVSITDIVSLTATNTISLQIYHDSVGDVNIANGATETWMAIHLISA